MKRNISLLNQQTIYDNISRLLLMKYKKIFIVIILLFSFSFSLKSSENVKVSAILGTIEDEENQTISVVFKFKINDKWHIYWKNPGDSGLETKIILTDTSSFKILDIYYQTPFYFKDEDLISFGYSDYAFLLVKIKAKNTLKNIIEDKLKFNVSWLECKEKCIPGKQKIELSLSGAKVNFTEYLKYFPIEENDWQFSAKLEDENVSIKIVKPYWYNYHIPDITFFPIEQGYFKNKEHKFKEINENEAMLEIPLDTFREKDPNEVKAVFKFSNFIDKENIFNSIEKSIIIQK